MLGQPGGVGNKEGQCNAVGGWDQTGWVDGHGRRWMVRAGTGRGRQGGRGGGCQQSAGPAASQRRRSGDRQHARCRRAVGACAAGMSPGLLRCCRSWTARGCRPSFGSSCAAGRSRKSGGCPRCCCAPPAPPPPAARQSRGRPPPRAPCRHQGRVGRGDGGWACMRMSTWCRCCAVLLCCRCASTMHTAAAAPAASSTSGSQQPTSISSDTAGRHISSSDGSQGSQRRQQPRQHQQRAAAATHLSGGPPLASIT